MHSIESKEAAMPATVSVITVVYNGADSIEQTMGSVLEQDYPYIEYIVIDGGSIDGTPSLIERHRPRLSRYISERDMGVYDAMNKGIRMASGDFLLFMNCGDVFANESAISSAMRLAEGKEEQVIFGSWMRKLDGRPPVSCRPQLEKGIFNHQAVLYSRSIHAWHGEYVNIKGLTAADYLFFATLFDSSRVQCKIVESILAIIEVNGISSGPQTLSQKLAVDFICGRTSKLWLLIVLVLHPIYRRAKSVLSRLR